MDIRMQEMDGISATRQITAALPEANIRIVRDYDDADLRAAARAAGARAYVVKESLLDVRSILTANTPTLRHGGDHKGEVRLDTITPF